MNNEVIKKEYKEIRPFKIWALENFPFIESDFDSLTTYDLLCKIVEYINSIASQFNDISENLNYLNNWFNNLDVQDEIDNKLDQMVEDGVLDQIIEQYLNSSAIWGFNNVQEMKEATNLIDGSFARTLGFYEKNDGGSATYKIREKTNEDIIDEMSIIALYDNTLIAEIIIDNLTCPEQFGAKGDGETNDLNSINKCLEKAKKVIMNKNYYVEIESDKYIEINSNQELTLNGTITMNGTNLDGYRIISLNNINNVIIDGCGKIIGDRNNHIGNTGEWGFGISIVDSTNVKIKDLTIINCWGDGIYIGRSNYHSKNILVDNIVCDNNRRQGISIVDGDYITITNSSLNNTNGTAPQSGIDIEPNYPSDFIGNINVSNCNMLGNAGDSITYILNNGQGGSNILISNIKVDKAVGGCTKQNDKITVNNVTMLFNTLHNGLLIYSDSTSSLNYSNINCISNIESATGATGIIQGFFTSTLSGQAYNINIDNLIATGNFPRFYTGTQYTSDNSNGIHISGNIEKATFTTPVSNAQLKGSLICKSISDSTLSSTGVIGVQDGNISFLNCNGSGDQRVVVQPVVMTEGQKLGVLKSASGNLVISFYNVNAYYNGTYVTTLTLPYPAYIECECHRDYILVK